jgi:lipoyl(octanoyl) transferase
LEGILIGVAAKFGVTGERVEGRTGVWVNTDEGYQKLASIGIRVSEKVTMHGFALNCNNSLEPFDHIIACGIDDAKATTLSKLAGMDISPAQAATLVEQQMGEIPNVRN